MTAIPQYYISENPYYHNLSKEQLKNVWEATIDWFDALRFNEEVEITLFEWVISNEIKLDLSDLSKPDFEGEYPSEIILTSKPFVINENSQFIGKVYQLNDNILEKLRTKWLHELIETKVAQRFNIKIDGRIHYWLSETIGMLLYRPQLTIFSKEGLHCEKWDVLLNDTL